jgi:threonine dehydrogenase-like Zn-dependent dehydrogenase
MKAIVRGTYGSSDVLELRDIGKPEIADEEVLVHVHAAGVGRDVWHVMTGLPYPIRLAGYGFRAPKNPVIGSDVAGVVEALGKNVSRFQPGDEVFGIGKGSYAEYVCARENKLAPKPENLTFEQAAVVAIMGSTALQALRDHGKVRPGQEVLIIGASGGVGTYAVQIAKAFGAHVTGVCSTEKVEMVRSIGADHVIDYTQEDFAEGDQRYDLILDIGGNSSRCHACGAPSLPGGPSSSLEARGRTVARRHRSPAPGDDVIAVRGPEAWHVRRQGEPRGPARPQGAHRVREDHTGHRPDVPTGRGPRSHPVFGRRTRSRESRHHRVRRTREVYSPECVEGEFSEVVRARLR